MIASSQYFPKTTNFSIFKDNNRIYILNNCIYYAQIAILFKKNFLLINYANW